MSTLPQRAGVVALVIAAMALGRVISDVATAEEPNDPFVRTGGVGDTVEMEYAEIAVTGVRSGVEIESDTSLTASVERFLVVDLELTATQRTTTFNGVYLVDDRDRTFVSDSRMGCAAGVTPVVAVTWRASYCFEVPKAALQGLHVVVARSDYGINGSDQRRDEVAEVDLGIDADRVEELWDTDERVTVESDGPA